MSMFDNATIMVALLDYRELALPVLHYGSAPTSILLEDADCRNLHWRYDLTRITQANAAGVIEAEYSGAIDTSWFSDQPPAHVPLLVRTVRARWSFAIQRKALVTIPSSVRISRRNRSALVLVLHNMFPELSIDNSGDSIDLSL